jgi:tetratricopeptide (TPR) repeat protein
MRFSRRNLPANFGIEPFFQPNLSTETAMDRLATALYFAGWGWWVCLTGGLLILIPCLRISGRRNMRWAALTASVMLATQGMVLFKGFAAQYLQEQGDRDMTRGRYAEAIERYEATQRCDPQLTKSEQIHLHLGDAYYQLGIPSHPNARFYLGDRYAQGMNFEAAIAEYLIAAQEASAPLREIIRKRIAWTYLSMGLGQYRKGEINSASGWWEIALASDPAQLQAAYFLVRAYFDQGRYEQSITMGRFLLLRSHNRLLNANVQANLGDGYWKLHDFANARRAYEGAMRLDSFANFRIFRSLGGT